MATYSPSVNASFPFGEMRNRDLIASSKVAIPGDQELETQVANNHGMSCINLVKAESEDSLSAVIELVGSELRELDLRREEVTRRIRNLSLAIAALKKFSGLSDEAGAFGECLRVVERPLARRNVSARIQRSKQQRDGQSLSLRRACRIALLETAEAIPAAEIRARILRRGSFLFLEPNSAVPAILAELNRMADDGEVCFSGAGHDCRWRRASWIDESQVQKSKRPQAPDV